MTRTEERGLAILEIFAEGQHSAQEKPAKRKWLAWDPPRRSAASSAEKRANRSAVYKRARAKLKAKRAAIWAAIRGKAAA